MNIHEIISAAFITAFVLAAGAFLGVTLERQQTVSYLRDGPICSETTKRAADAIERKEHWR